MAQYDSRRINIREISYFRFVLEFVDTSKFRINYNLETTDILHYDVHSFMIISRRDL